jgi:predicted DNA binding CopG/RHH family protein
MPRSKRMPTAVPTFKNEAEERRFWETHDPTDYVDWSSARSVRFPNLKPSTETISLRLPAGLLADLKALANKQDVPYQSLLKMFLADRSHGNGGRRGWPAPGLTRRCSRRAARGAEPNRRGVHGRLAAERPSIGCARIRTSCSSNSAAGRNADHADHADQYGTHRAR